jgi:hypothetical protein
MSQTDTKPITCPACGAAVEFGRVKDLLLSPTLRCPQGHAIRVNASRFKPEAERKLQGLKINWKI